MFQIIALLVSLTAPLSFAQRGRRRRRGDARQRLSSWAAHSEDLPAYVQSAALHTDAWLRARDSLRDDVWGARTRDALRQARRDVRGEPMRALPRGRRRYIARDMDARQSASVAWHDYRRRRVCRNAAVAGRSLQRVEAALRAGRDAEREEAQ